MRWVEAKGLVVVEVGAVALVADQAGWAVPLPLALAATVYAPIVVTESRTWRASHAIRKSAPSAARR